MATGRQNREEYEALRRNLKAAIGRRSPTVYSIAQKMNSLGVSDPELGPIIEALASRQFSAMAEAQRHFGVKTPSNRPDSARPSESPGSGTETGTPFENAGEGIKAKKPSDIGRIGQVAKNIRDLQKRAQNYLRALKAAGILANPWTWVVIGIAILIILIILFVVILSIVLNKNQMTPHPGGKSQAQAADPIADREFVRKLLALTGDQDIKNEAIAGNNKKLLTQIDDLITEIRKPENADLPDRDQIKKDYLAIRDIAQNISPSNSNNAALYDQVIAKLKETRKYLSAPLAAYPGPSTLPLNLPRDQIRTGNSLHHCTRWRPDHCFKGSGHGTFVMNSSKRSDAVDLSPTTKPVHDVKIIAVFDGTIKDKEHGGVDTKKEYFYLTDTTGQYKAVYAHVKLNDGTKNVKKGDEIGYILDSIGHLHFELYQITKIGLRPLNYTEEDIKACGLDKNPLTPNCPNGRRIGDYYWDYLTLILQK
ncbi:MAG: M23 family metallopeptidase [Patescibacteria group bacterium]